MSKAPTDKQAAKTQLLWAASAIGFSSGLFAGMTESPVGSALVAAMLGLVSGGGVYALLARARGQKPATAAAGDGPLPEPADEVEWPLVHTLARGVQLLCVLAIVGVPAGVSLREGWVFARPAAPVTETLTDLGPLAGKVDRRVLLRLVLLQSQLAALGVPVRENNRLVGSFIVEGEVDHTRALGETNLRQLRRDTRDAQEQVRHALVVLSTPGSNGPEGRPGEILDDEERRLKPVGELRFGDVERAYRPAFRCLDEMDPASRGRRRCHLARGMDPRRSSPTDS